ncbi:FAD-dependent oxidoreductase [Paenibacillus eucommiae]|uniref:Thioredoxin reductase n=1 Tax=Paenibacillus eucommiae TaxID=1355755 RepID=A0ABS4IQ29_9BACL|nr:FAD-dependent oxidoreductase [Paenibacillus eucommiae]MBP1989670.1 thioredoxin reductase [Paenibacillus eucommiae]
MPNIKINLPISSCCTPSNHSNNNNLPIAIIGAGPIGLAAAAHLAERGETFIVLEQGPQIGNNIMKWGHVRLFSPWQYNIDQAAKKLLSKHGWETPPPEELPLGKEIVELYLKPLANLPEIQPHVNLNTSVITISRKGIDKMKSANRESLPFIIYTNNNGTFQRFEAKAIIDASGTWGQPNPVLANGIWTNEEQSLHHNIYYGIPNITGIDKERYVGKRIAVVGGGHSALNTLLDLAQLKEADQQTEICWIMRKERVEDAYGGKENDQLAARGELGSRIHQLVESGQIQVVTPFKIEGLIQKEKRITIIGDSDELQDIDEIIVNTGSRPDFSFLRELRLSLDQATESVEILAPLIDPNVHSCGTVRPHGERELRHLEKNFYIAGMKSYGRAPTFLMATGYEQVRSIVAYLTGDLEAAERVELVLPETGVCSIRNVPVNQEVNNNPTLGSSSCCN